MRKTGAHFERVPVEVAERVLEQENLSAHHDGDRRIVVRKSRKAPGGPHTLTKKVEIPVL